MTRPALDAAKKHFEDYLEDHGARFTRQRREILEALYYHADHLSADDLSDIIRRHDKGISKATVYRTLALLVESGLVEANDFERGHRVYEFADSLKGHRHHDHILCVDGETVVEFHSGEIERLIKKIALKHGFALLSHKLVIYAKCADCADDEPGHGHDHATLGRPSSPSSSSQSSSAARKKPANARPRRTAAASSSTRES